MRTPLIKLKKYIFLLFRPTKPATVVPNTAVSPLQAREKVSRFGSPLQILSYKNSITEKYKINLY